MTTASDISCRSATVEEICATLRKYGVAKLPAYATPSDVEAVMGEAKFATSRHANYLNPYGPCARFTLEPLPARLSRSRDLVTGEHLDPLPARFTVARRLLDRQVLRQTTRAYLGHQAGFLEVVAFTQDRIPDTSAVYGKLHYDRRHQLKFILYLNDTDEANGAFGCMPGSHHVGRRLFHHGWRRALGLSDRDASVIERAAAGIAEDDPAYHRVPCVLESRPQSRSADRRRLVVNGEAGTLVIFDTHLLHFGGFVSSPARSRWTLKGHSFAQVD